MATIFYTASSVDGFIADPGNSLSWLLTRDVDPSGPMGFQALQPRIGASVMGATTWQWLLDHDEVGALGEARTFVLSHRAFDLVDGITFTSADDEAALREVHAGVVAAAEGRDVWLVGGGDLVGQFADLGLVDELWVQYAPVALGGGAPLLPRRLELRLEEVERNRDFAVARWSVLNSATLTR
ncbi:dihydrofolate reductase family protein [Nocardioides sp. 616]|uniref:dihydrofolate reductase family protein n=1 Tax=Nocardioides sp. 616 TaxID=2268090 RepID=UPI000CE3AB34|nr:dihydrofolate reductase family protein [Nocardioides sp. 616]